MMGPEEIARLERATVASLAPRRVEERSGWILPMDSAPMGRARSAAPLSHDPPPDVSDAVLSDLAEAYVEAGLPPAFRLPDRPTFDVVRGRLEATGFAPGEPTTVMIADPARVAVYGGPGAAPEPILLEAPDAEWAAVFCGPGFDPEEGARRVAQLARSPGARFGAIREAGQTLAVGVLSRAGGLGGVHGMRTAVEHRGRGCAGRLLAAFGAQAADWGLPRLFLQVEVGNPARSLYEAAGFEDLWRYVYWR
ncbi:MAG: GNAT family N-acetyltransferase [Phenylobacterium sp.]|nr:GNAT family N-acetyltransferase [Phenylobacterium sp.]